MEVQRLLQQVDQAVQGMLLAKDEEIRRLQQQNMQLQMDLDQKTKQFTYFKEVIENMFYNLQGDGQNGAEQVTRGRQPLRNPTATVYEDQPVKIDRYVNEEEEAFNERDLMEQSQISKSALANRKLKQSLNRLSNSPLNNVEYIEDDSEESEESEEERKEPVGAEGHKLRSPYKYNQLKDKISSPSKLKNRQMKLTDKYDEYLSPESKKIIQKLSKLH